jgi:hypothetical protein
MSIGLTSLRLAATPSATVQSPVDNKGLPTNPTAQTRSRISPPLPPWHTMQTRWQCTFDWLERHGLSWKFRMCALLRLRETLWNQKIQKTLCYYGNAFLHYMILLLLVAFLILFYSFFCGTSATWPFCSVPVYQNEYESCVVCTWLMHTHSFTYSNSLETCLRSSC